MTSAWTLRSFSNRPTAAAERVLPSRLPGVMGHLRLSLALGTGAMLLWWFAGIFRRDAIDDHLAPPSIWANGLSNLWPGPLLAGAGVFALLALPAIWPLFRDRRLAAKLRAPGLLPGKLFGPILHWSISLTLSITMAMAACLCLLFLECQYETTIGQVESLTLPIAYEACAGAPPEPRLIVNVLPDGVIRVDGVCYVDPSMGPPDDRPRWDVPWGWDADNRPPRSIEAFRDLLAQEAARHRQPDGWSALSVYVRADANVQAKYLYLVMDACRRTKVYRLSFGVSPEDAGRTAESRTE